jgi:hypothetical protein
MFSFLWSFTSFPVLPSLILFFAYIFILYCICFSLLVAQCSLCFHPLFLLLPHHVLPLPRFLSWRLCACLTYYQCVLLLPGLELYHAGTWFLQPPSPPLRPLHWMTETLATDGNLTNGCCGVGGGVVDAGGREVVVLLLMTGGLPMSSNGNLTRVGAIHDVGTELRIYRGHRRVSLRHKPVGLSQI